MSNQNKANPQNIKSNSQDKIKTNEQNILDRLNNTLKKGLNNIKSSKNKINKDKKSSQLDTSNSILENITPNMENYTIVIGVFLALVILFIMFFISKTFNVGRTVERIKMYERYQKITNYQYRNTAYGELKLCEVSMLSSYNSCLNNAQMLTYTSERILQQIIKSGARFVEFNVFSSKFGVGGKPVVSNGYKRGEWKLTLNSTPFENVIATLKNNAFKTLSEDGGSPNPNDPLFISLNLSTGYNIYCLDLIADILLDYFSERLLDPKYAFQFSNNIHDIKMSELENKVVIFASNGFEGSKLEELVNGVWINETKVIKSNPNLMSFQESFFSKSNKEKTQETDTKKIDKNNNKDIKKKIRESIKKDGKIKTKEIVNTYNKDGKLLEPDEIKESISLLQTSNFNDKKLTQELSNVLDINLEDSTDMNKSSNNNKKNNKTINTTAKEEKFIGKLDELYDIFNDDIENNGSTNNKSNNNKHFKEKFNNDDNDDNNGNDDLNLDIKPKSKIIRITSQIFNKPEFNGDRIRAHNKAGLTIVVPNIEGDIFNQNHDPTVGFQLGCQFVCMNFQYVNEAMDTYITKFEKKAIIPIKKLIK